MPLTDDQIREALAVCEAATPGPWSARLGGGNIQCAALGSDHPERFDEFVVDFLPDWALESGSHAPKDHLPNLQFVENARAHYAKALQELLEARKRVAELDEEVARRELQSEIEGVRGILRRGGLPAGNE